jgi:hypothetical protein
MQFAGDVSVRWRHHTTKIWRLFTNFLFYDYFGLNFFFHMFFVIRHCQMLEETSFRGRTGDFAYLWVFCGLLLIVSMHAAVLCAECFINR